jgi:hypothetical protein
MLGYRILDGLWYLTVSILLWLFGLIFLPLFLAPRWLKVMCFSVLVLVALGSLIQRLIAII